jgi:hypothetical protein
VTNIEKTFEHGVTTTGVSGSTRLCLVDVVLSAFTPKSNGDKIGERIPLEIIKWGGIRTLLAIAYHVLHTSIRHYVRLERKRPRLPSKIRISKSASGTLELQSSTLKADKK